MLKINRKVEYALMVLKLMHERGTEQLTTAREMSELFNIPFDTTAKAMQGLNLAGILASVKGVKGGYYLNIDLAQVSYLRLVELIEGKNFALDCAEGKCDLLGTCNISTPMKRFNHYITGVFEQLSVKQLVEGA